MSPQTVFNLFKETFTAWKNDNVSVWCAALSYYTIFSISPLLIIIISLLGIFFGKSAIEGNVYRQISGLLGSHSAAFIQTMIASSSKPKTNIISSIIGIIVLILGAAGVFGQLEQALNHIWHVETKPKAGIWSLIRNRFLSFSMIVVIGFLLVVSLVISALIAAIATFFNHFLPASPIILAIIDEIISLILLTFMFGLVFKILPDIKIPWKVVWQGAFVTSILFTIGKFLLGLYIGKSSFSSTYGAAAALVVILVWIYYAGQIIFFGAEFTKIYAAYSGVSVQPNKYAKFIEGVKTTVVKKKQKQLNPILQVLFLIAAFFYKPRK